MGGPWETAQTRSLTGCSPWRKRNSFSNLYMISEQLVWEEQTQITQILSLFQYEGSCHIDVFSLNRVTVFTSLRGRPCVSGSCVAWLPALRSPCMASTVVSHGWPVVGLRPLTRARWSVYSSLVPPSNTLSLRSFWHLLCGQPKRQGPEEESRRSQGKGLVCFICHN